MHHSNASQRVAAAAAAVLRLAGMMLRCATRTSDEQDSATDSTDEAQAERCRLIDARTQQFRDDMSASYAVTICDLTFHVVTSLRPP